MSIQAVGARSFGMFQNVSIATSVLLRCPADTWKNLTSTCHAMRDLVCSTLPAAYREWLNKFAVVHPNHFSQIPAILRTDPEIRKIAGIVRRAAFDFGSGKIAIHVADVNCKTHEIVESLYRDKRSVKLSEDAVKQIDGTLSAQIQEDAIQVARTFKQKALALGAQEFSGIATEAYRQASNAQALVERYCRDVHIPTRIIPSLEEGRNSFLEAVEKLSLDPNDLVSWEIGGGSCQITYLDEEHQIQVYGGPFGRSNTKTIVVKDVKNQDPSKVGTPNPMSREEWEQAVQVFCDKLILPETLLRKLGRKDLHFVGIGGHPDQLRKRTLYNKEDILEVVQRNLGKNDAELASEYKWTAFALSELAFVYAVMEKLHISSVQCVEKSGVFAVLTSEEYWK